MAASFCEGEEEAAMLYQAPTCKKNNKAILNSSDL
jgi:hypothetical protein